MRSAMLKRSSSLKGVLRSLGYVAKELEGEGLLGVPGVVRSFRVAV